MAGNDITLNIGANLTPAQRQLQAFVNQAQRQVGSQSFEFKLNDKGFRQPLGRITGDLNQFQGAMDASIARTLAFGASVGAVAGVTKAFKDMVAVTVKVEHALKEINVLLNLSTTDLSKFSKELFGVAKNTASSFDTVAVAATEFSRQGLSAAETAKRVNAALILTRLSGLEAEASVSALTAAVNGFRREAVSTTEVVNRLANVDAAFAVSSADLAKALSRAGSVSQDAKVKFNELLAATTAVQQATARGGNVIGNGFKTIFTRLQRSKVREELEKIGVATTDSMGSMRGAISILKDYARVYQTLSDQQKAYTSEQVAGVFQINTLKALVNDLSNEYGVYNRALQVANNTTNEAIQRNAELNKTLQSLASQTGTEIEELASKIGAISFEGNFKGILGFLKSALGDINSTLDSESFGGDLARGVLKGFGNFLTGPGLAIALVGMTKLLFFIGKQTSSALQQVLAIGSQSQKRQIVQTRINALLAEDNNLLRQIMSSSGNINDINQIVTRSINQQNAALANQKLLVNQIAAAFQLTKSGSVIPMPVGGGGRGKRGAEGFVPNLVRQERSSISRGVGGARGGDRPVILPNFNFGGGKSGTMVAHTGEHIVPNFAGGGSAIFNRDMASSMGLPSGAKRVGAAQGFVPNFSLFKSGPNKGVDLSFKLQKDGAYGKKNQIVSFKGSDLETAVGAGAITRAQVKKSGYRTGKEIDADRLKAAQKQLSAYDADKQAFGRGAFMAVPGAGASVFSHQYNEARKLGKENIKIIKGTAFGVNLNPSGAGGNDEEKRAIKQLGGVEETLDNSLVGAVNTVLADVTAEGNLKAVPTKVDKATLLSGSFLQKGGKGALAAIKGGIFEGLVNAVTRGLTGGTGTKGSPGGTSKQKAAATELDIVIDKKNQGFIEALFNLPTGKYRAGDFKRRQSTSTTTSFSKQLLTAAQLGIIGSKTTMLSPAQLKELHDADMSKFVKDPKGLSGAGGFIPSFANLAGMASTSAGKRAMAAETAVAGSARMGYDSRVGYGVFNHSQGSLTNAVSQHLSAGDSASSLSSMGSAAQAAVSAALGFVPSFQMKPRFSPAYPSRGDEETALRKKNQYRLNRSTKALANAQNLTVKDVNFHNSQIKRASSQMKRLGVAVTGLENAAEEGSKALKVAAKGDRRRAKQAKREKGGAAMRGVGVSMIGQQIVGILSETLSKRGDFESQYKAQQINRTSTFAATGATVGAMSGVPGGLVIGALAGGLLGFASSFDPADKALQKFAFETEKAAAAQTQGNISLDNYVQKLSAYEQEADPSKRQARRNDLIAALTKLPPEMASHFKGVGFNLKNTIAIQQSIMQQQQKIAMVTAVKMANAMDKAAMSMNVFEKAFHGAKGFGMWASGEFRGSGENEMQQIANKLFLERMGKEAPEVEGMRKRVGQQMGAQGIASEAGQVLLARAQVKGGPAAGTLGQIAEVVNQQLLQGDSQKTQVPHEKLAQLADDFDITTVGELFKTLGITISDHKSITAKSGKKISELSTIFDRDVVPVIRSAIQTMLLTSNIEGRAGGQTSVDVFNDFLKSNAAFQNAIKEIAQSLSKDTQTSKFLGALGEVDKSFITGLPSGAMSDEDKLARIFAIDRQKVEREGGLALEKQNLSFYEDIEKARAAAAKEDPTLAENLKHVETLLAEGFTVEEMLADEALGFDKQTVDLLSSQLDATNAIKKGIQNQKDLQKVNNLRTKALAEEARRQKTRDSLEGDKFNKELGFKLRSAVDRITGRGEGAKTGGTNILAQRLQAEDYEFIVSNFGDVLSKELKELYEKEISGRRSFTAMAGLTDSLAPGLRPRGQEFTGVQDYVKFLIPQLEQRLRDPTLSGRDRERYKVLLDIARNTKRAYEISEERKEFEKRRGELRLKSIIGRGPSIQQGVGEAGMKHQAEGLIVASKNLKSKLDRAEKIYGGGDKKAGKSQDTILRAELAAIMGGTEADEKHVAGMSREDLIKELRAWNKEQVNVAEDIKMQIKEMEESRKTTKDLSENTKKNKNQLIKLRKKIQELIEKGISLNPNKEPPLPFRRPGDVYDVGGGATGADRKGNKAAGFIPSLARGGVADAFARERRDINSGVGGARPGIDQPRLINNFNGRPVVAHTGEYLVNNFEGSGKSAIFNRAMVSKGGMPAGATSIGGGESGATTSSGGYVPNMALPLLGFLANMGLRGSLAARVGGSAVGKGLGKGMVASGAMALASWVTGLLRRTVPLEDLTEEDISKAIKIEEEQTKKKTTPKPPKRRPPKIEPPTGPKPFEPDTHFMRPTGPDWLTAPYTKKAGPDMSNWSEYAKNEYRVREQMGWGHGRLGQNMTSWEEIAAWFEENDPKKLKDLHKENVAKMGGSPARGFVRGGRKGFKSRRPSQFKKGGRKGFKSRRLPSQFAGGYIPNMAMGPLEIIAEKRKKLYDYKYGKGGLWDKQNPAMAPGGGGDTPIEQSKAGIAVSKKKARIRTLEAWHETHDRQQGSGKRREDQLAEMRAAFSEKRRDHEWEFQAKREAFRLGESVVAPYQTPLTGTQTRGFGLPSDVPTDMIHPRTSKRINMPEGHFDRYKSGALEHRDVEWRKDRAKGDKGFDRDWTYPGGDPTRPMEKKLSFSERANLKERSLSMDSGGGYDFGNLRSQGDLNAARQRWAQEEAEEAERKRAMEARRQQSLSRLTRHSEGYIPANEFLNFSEGGVAAAAPAGGGEMSTSGGAEGGAQAQRGITRAKASQEKHNVNVNIEVYGNVTDGAVDGIQSNSSDMATVLEGLVNGGM